MVNCSVQGIYVLSDLFRPTYKVKCSWSLLTFEYRPGLVVIVDPLSVGQYIVATLSEYTPRRRR